MKSPIPDYLRSVLEDARTKDGGAPSSYIDLLAEADTSKLAIALAMVDGEIYSVGDDEEEFSIQSVSKAFVYAIAIEDVGLAAVLEKIGMEPSGDSFNRLSLQKGTNRPFNPMINAGAIAAHALVLGPNATQEERVSRILAVFSRLAGRQLYVDEKMFEAEMRNADRNMGIGYMLKAAGMITCNPVEAVTGYIRQCSINVNVKDLAMMASVLGNAGIHPVTGERIMPQESARQVLSVMATCGMYDYAGEWLATVGFSAKSGVAGAIMGALPGQVGIATFSPRLDERGNSVRGVEICRQLSADMGLHLMNSLQVASSTIQTSIVNIVASPGSAGTISPNSEREVYVFNLRGAVRFAGAEKLTRALERNLPGLQCDTCVVVLSFRETYSLNEIARRVIHENIKRLLEEGKIVVVTDPSGVVGWESPKIPWPAIFKSELEARDYIGGAGCHIISRTEGW